MSTVSSLALGNATPPPKGSKLDLAANAKPAATTNVFENSATDTGSSKSFLGIASASPVQRLVDAQKAASKKTSYEDTPEFMQRKAIQLKGLMTTYQNMGLTDAYNSAYNEASALVQKYLKLYGDPTSKSSGAIDTSA